LRAEPGQELLLSVLIASYRTRDRTLACVRSIYQETRESRFEIILVDNGSADGTVEAISRDFPEVEVFPLENNVGYARAINLAASRAHGDTLILLNPDTVVLKGALDRLREFADAHPGHGLYGGRTVGPSGNLDPRSSWALPTWWSLTCFGFGLSTAFPTSRLLNPESLGGWRRDSVREVGVITGSLCLIPRSVWDELGGFDPLYFMYGEDADLAQRAARRGYRPFVTPSATIVHEVGASSATTHDKSVLLMRGKVTFIRRNWQGFLRIWGLTMLVAGVALRASLSRARLGPHRDLGWPMLWQARREWIAGYQPPGPLNEMLATPLARSRASGRRIE
jgi:N-acetylglucosaminyl-diphospho-decaprenol L-rhamnosyltransferase